MKGWLNRSIRIGFGTVGILILALLLAYGSLLVRRPPRTLEERVLFQGVTYRREPRSVPRPVMIHVVTLDLNQSGIDFRTTPGEPTPQERPFRAQTTTEFLQRFRLKLAINASFFFPFHERHPLDFYPRSGERVEVLGQVIANGVEYSKPRGGWAVLCILKNRQVQIPNRLECPPETVQGVAGSLVLINQGKPQPINPAILRQDKP
ncbi:MAG: phosphodiester glycosidase family protein, partial [Leptolyngbyaceae cyanobacterium bins.59]|nr:phosphodiester glycosidase family protein [Leptolyngbyaceae cyanobacterium bins.59]